MEENTSKCLFGKSVYFLMDEVFMGCGKKSEDRAGEFVSTADWREAEEALVEAGEAECVLVLILRSAAEAADIKWIAIIEDIEKDEELTTVSYNFIEKLTIQESSSLETQGFLQNLSVDTLSSVPVICATPDFVNDYLIANEIELVEEERQNKFFFEKCIFVIRDMNFVVNAGIDESAMGKFSDTSDWTEVSKILAQTKADGRMLNILVSDGPENPNIRWLAVIDAIKSSGATTSITFGFVDDLNRLETGFSKSWLDQCNGADIEIEAASKGYSICHSPQLVNLYLNNVFGGISVEEFKEALSEANVTAKQRQMLSLHYRAPGHLISMGTMARLMGYKNFNAANLHYGKFAGRIAEQLGCPIESNMDNISTLAFASEAKDEVGHFQWKMHEELAQALEELGWVGNIVPIGVDCASPSTPS